MEPVRPPEEPVPDAFLELRPVRRQPWQRDANGHATLLVPRFRKGLLARFVQPRLKGERRFFHIHLDDLGTAVWELADGSRTMRQIADAMLERFGERPQLLERLRVFVDQLLQGKLVVALEPDQEPDPTECES